MKKNEMLTQLLFSMKLPPPTPTPATTHPQERNKSTSPPPHSPWWKIWKNQIKICVIGYLSAVKLINVPPTSLGHQFSGWLCSQEQLNQKWEYIVTCNFTRTWWHWLCKSSKITYKLTHPLNSVDNSNPWMATIVTLCVCSNTTYKLTHPLNSVDNSNHLMATTVTCNFTPTR